MKSYAKVIVNGSPISKSNFKLSNSSGRAILPYNSGKYNDRYAIYEEEIAYETRVQNPGIFITEAIIAVLKVYYKSIKRHPDTNNITKSIFDGIEKSGLIINDAQIRRLVIEEYYDEKSPRFELELFGESAYKLNYSVEKKELVEKEIEYSPPSNKKKCYSLPNRKRDIKPNELNHCQICGKMISKCDSISANKGTTVICKDCLKKLF